MIKRFALLILRVSGWVEANKKIGFPILIILLVVSTALSVFMIYGLATGQAAPCFLRIGEACSAFSIP